MAKHLQCAGGENGSLASRNPACRDRALPRSRSLLSQVVSRVASDSRVVLLLPPLPAQRGIVGERQPVPVEAAQLCEALGPDLPEFAEDASRGPFSEARTCRGALADS